MKRIKNCFLVLFAMLAMVTISSCDDDEDDCGFPAVQEANDNFEAAVAAYSADATAANCEAVRSAVTNFENASQNVDVNCLNENDAANLIGWSISVSLTDPTC